MNIYKKSFLNYLTAILFAVIFFSGAVYSQFKVSICGAAPGNICGQTTTIVPATGSVQITVNIAQTGSESLNKLIVYRNDVPYLTYDGTSYSRTFTETGLGQDTYKYHARAYGTSNGQNESELFNLTVDFPSSRVFKMGGWIGPANQPASVYAPGPSRTVDHTIPINQALTYISVTGGGTLFFPCDGGPYNNDISVYNISGTIRVPSNVTLQGESARGGFIDASCRIYWGTDLTATGCWNPTNINDLQDLPMFEISGTAEHIRFKDLAMVTRYRGQGCTEVEIASRIYSFNNSAFLLDAQSTGNIKDVIFENVAIDTFKYGIKAIGNSISDVKMRGITPYGNYRQLSINADFAYDWDIQNFNMTGMLEDQGAVEIIHAGAPAEIPADRKPLKFLQLNCNGNFSRTSDFCVEITKHGGLYFKQLHVEGAKKAIVVKDIGTATNNEPIILEHSVAVGEFRDDSMKLYLVGSNMLAAPDPQTVQETPEPYRHIDTQLMEFYGAGWQSTVVDCGDLHADRTDVRILPAPSPSQTPSRPSVNDWQMQFSHAERNRESLFSLDSNNKIFPKPHTVCPTNMPGYTNINEVGGYHFNTGVLPVAKDSRYTNSFSCPSTNTPTYCTIQLNNKLNNTPNGGTVQINGKVTVNGTINIPNGRQIAGGTDGELYLEFQNPSDPGDQVDLLQIKAATRIEEEQLVAVRISGITIRDLKLSTNRSLKTSGIAIVGADDTTITGVMSDMHFSGLVIQGFERGLDVKRFGSAYKDQMVDGISWKNIHFINNRTAASVVPQNVSNWNIIDLKIESDSDGAVGWYQASTGNSTQNVTCSGTETHNMSDCIKLNMGGIHLSGLKKTQNVVNTLTYDPNSFYFGQQYQAPVFGSLVLRDNDFVADDKIVNGQQVIMGAVNFNGKSLVTSLNNRYKSFKVDPNPANQGRFTRVTYCGDTFANGTDFPYLADYYNDLYVGVDMPTRIKCGKSNDLTALAPKPWKDVVRWGDEPRTDSNPSDPFKADKPLVGNLMGDAAQELVIYREKLPKNEFRIKKFDGTADMVFEWGNQHDIPFIGKFYTSSLDQAVIWRPSTGQWWIYNPVTDTHTVIPWGLSCSAPYTNCDVPFIGNFIDESGSQGDNLNEIGIYRPSDFSIWILNPRTGVYVYLGRDANYGSQLQIGDFLHLGYDQIAQLKIKSNNKIEWNILNPRSPYNTQIVEYGESGDTPVAGKYLSGTCSQVAVWKPSSEEFRVTDAKTDCSNTGSIREKIMKWGSNNDSSFTGSTPTPTECTSGICPDDIPLRINLGDGIHRPTSYRPTNGIYPKSRAKGQWWIHDPFLQN